MSIEVFKVEDDDDDIRLDRWFKRHHPALSQVALQKALRKKDVKVNGKKVEPKHHVMAGDEIAVKPFVLEQAVKQRASDPKTHKPESRPLTEQQIQETKWMVMEQTKDAILLNKPAGLAVQGGSGIKDSIDARLYALRDEQGNRPKLTHRLDKDTSGVLLLARNAKSAARYAKAFSSKQTTKVYWALVMGSPEIREGTIDLPLDKQQGGAGERMVVTEKGKRALTHYRVIDALGENMSWVELMPVTGRTHQLRVHMMEIGHPIVGDGKYGGREAFPSNTALRLPKQLHLHARRLIMPGEFDHIAPLPPHMVETWKLLGLSKDDEGYSLADRD